MELSQKISNGRGLVEHQFLFNKTTLFCVSPISDVGLEKLLSLAVKEDLIARNGKFVGYGFSRCEPKQEQLSPFSSSFLKRLVAKLAGQKKVTPDTLENRKKILYRGE